MPKNTTKYYSYKEAYSRIKDAIEKEFYLEAITIEESIISDRILSYLVGGKLLVIDESSIRSNKASLSNLIQLLGKSHPLHTKLDKWRGDRNFCIHSICKSYPGKPTFPIADFLSLAKQTAHDGSILAKEVNNWHKAEKRKSLV